MVCLDSSALIDFLKGKTGFNEELYNDIVVTSISILEIIRGLHLKSNLKNITLSEIDKFGLFIGSVSVLSFDTESAILAGEIEADLINRGQKIDVEDVMIASICITNNEGLLTNNVKHFERLKKFGLNLVK